MDQRYILTPYAYHSLIVRKNVVSRKKRVNKEPKLVSDGNRR